MIFNNFCISYCDVSLPYQLNIQDPATPALEGMIFFHNYLIFFIIVIGLFVFSILFIALDRFDEYWCKPVQIFAHSSVLEIAWTILPALVLLLIAVPSFALLYSLDEVIDPTLTVKIIGHQWYWTYEYSDYASVKRMGKKIGKTISLDSYMVPTSSLVKGAFRLLETDNRLTIPAHTHIRLLVTSSDVLHSWCVPSFGIKVDACPGRLSQASLFLKRRGTFHGQCSEICGVNHGFMPITVRVLKPVSYIAWVAECLGFRGLIPKLTTAAQWKHF
jgi:cytochrome c oxidase subunit 2